MVIVGAAGGGCRQKMFRQNYACAQPRTVGAVAALSDAIEPVAWSNDPNIRGRALQVLAEILENRGVFGGERREVVDCLVDARCQTGSGQDRKSTRLNSSHLGISYAVFCLKKKNTKT